MPGMGPTINGFYLHPDGAMLREEYSGPLPRGLHKQPWSFWDQWWVMWGGEPIFANRKSRAKTAVNQALAAIQNYRGGKHTEI